MSPELPLAKRIRFAFETAVATILLAAARWLPRPVVVSLGAGMGELAYRLDRKHTHVALDNLQSAFDHTLSLAEPLRSSADSPATLLRQHTSRTKTLSLKK